MKNTVPTRNPGRDKKGPRFDAARYEAMKATLLRVIPPGGAGVSFAALPGLVKRLLPKVAFRGASIPWYVATVKLDLEARGSIARVPGVRPQRIVRVG